MVNSTVRYFETEDGRQRRIYEKSKSRRKSTGPEWSDYEMELVYRRLWIEEYQDGEWVKVEELGDYVEPTDAP